MGMPKLSNFGPLVSVCCSRIVVEGTKYLKLVCARSCVESVVLLNWRKEFLKSAGYAKKIYEEENYTIFPC